MSPFRFQSFRRDGSRGSLLGLLKGRASGSNAVRGRVFGEAIYWLYPLAEGGVGLEAPTSKVSPSRVRSCSRV